MGGLHEPGGCHGYSEFGQVGACIIEIDNFAIIEEHLMEPNFHQVWEMVDVIIA